MKKLLEKMKKQAESNEKIKINEVDLNSDLKV